MSLYIESLNSKITKAKKGDIQNLIDVSKKIDIQLKIFNKFHNVFDGNQEPHPGFYKHFKLDNCNGLHKEVLKSIICEEKHSIISLQKKVEALIEDLKSKYMYICLLDDHIDGLNKITNITREIKNKISEFEKKYNAIKENISKNPAYVKKENIKQEIRDTIKNIEQIQENPAYICLTKHTGDNEYRLNNIKDDFESFLFLSELN